MTDFGPLVDAGQLEDLLSADDVVVVDSRWRLGDGPLRAAYEEGHIPGAVFVDVDTELSRPPGPGDGRHPLPDPEAFAHTMGALGIGEGTRVVVYDDAGGAIAARLWWMLHVLGQPVAVLDGGVAAWTGELERGPSRPTPVPSFDARPWPADRIATLAEVESHATATEDAFVLLDARAAARYRAEVDVDPRPGHIPGAVSADLAGNLDAEGRFLSPAELRSRYASIGAGAGDVVVSCGSGVTACHDALAMVRAGLPLPRVFVGGYSQWLADPARPVVTGTAPRE